MWGQVTKNNRKEGVAMDSERLRKRQDELKKENDEVNRQLAELEQMKNQLIREALVRNGRILELEELLKR